MMWRESERERQTSNDEENLTRGSCCVVVRVEDSRKQQLKCVIWPRCIIAAPTAAAGASGIKSHSSLSLSLSLSYVGDQMCAMIQSIVQTSMSRLCERSSHTMRLWPFSHQLAIASKSVIPL
mgnify:CR=1 FL=1